MALEWAASREQFGQKIGKFQGVSFKLADMRTRMVEAELMTYRAAWLMDRGAMSDGDAAMAKLSSTEMIQFVSDEAIQILGGMGLMDELPWSGSGAMPGWTESGTALARSSGTS